MRGLIRGPLLGAFNLTALIVNTLLWAIPVYFGIFLKLIAPTRSLRRAAERFTANTAHLWAAVDVWLGDHLMGTRWEVRLPTEGLSPRGQYIVYCNHQSWNDIYALMKAFGRRTPFFKFFLKKELIWVPVLGPVWWGLDYPFMKRYTRQYLAKHPEMRGKDLETTRIACEHYRHVPVTILNFLEGTRFTPAKKAQQKSPYKHLLRPRAGAMALTIAALGSKIDTLLDVTIVYPDGAKGFWDLLCGRVAEVVIEVQQRTIPPEMFQGDYENDAFFRKRFQHWLHTLWAEKDSRIEVLLEKNPGT